MKSSKKILIAVGAVVLVAAIVIGTVVALNARGSKPETRLDLQKLHESPLYFSQVYVVAQPPYTNEMVFDTPLGMETYWFSNHSGGNGIEFVLQQTKDGELIVLSEALPAQSNAADLYGKNVKVSDLTLEELRKVNFAYNFTDEDGFQSYMGLSDEMIEDITVVTLDEMLDRFSAPNRYTVRMYLRFFDESQITDLEKALQTIHTGLKDRVLTNKAVFLPQSEEAAAAADKACPGMLRAATTAEAKALVRECSRDASPEKLPYAVIYEKASGQFDSEKFIRYVRTLGLEIVLSDVDADDVVTYRDYGVSAIATGDAQSVIQILKDAKKADREAKSAAD